MPPYPSTIQGTSCPTFSPPPLKKFLDGSIQNLFDAIDWNKTHNGHHPLFEFTINKAEAAKLDESRTIEQPDSDQLLYQITWGDAYHAFENAARFASRQLKISPSLDSTPPVVAILAVADPITYFIFIVGLIRAGYIPFPISPRNSAVAVAHLISKTNTRHIFVSGDPAMQKLAENSLALLRENTENEVVQVPKTLDCYRMPYFLELYGYQESLTSEPLPDLRGIRQDSPALIMHSSGSTAFPKPITLTHRIFLQHGTAFYYGEVDVTGLVFAVHSVPLFHIMGARQIASTTLTGITLLMFPPVLSENGAPVLPSPGKVLDSALATHCDVLIVVPAFIEAWAQDESLIESLRTFKSICYGGGPLSPEVGNMLSEKGVNLLTMYGITEIGVMAMALPLRPSAEGWDWWRICPRLDIELPPLDDDPTIFRLIVKESNTNALAVSNLEIDGIRAYDTKDLAIRHPTNPNLFKLLGRLDDQIMHSNGEKTNPGPIEFILQRDPRIKAALMFGRSKFQPGVLIVPSDEFAFNSSDLTRVAGFREAIWETVEKANEYAPQHSKIFKEACTWFARTLIFNDPLTKLILIANPDKPLEYTAKGTPRRQFCINLYETEIEHLYRTFEDSAAEDSITLDTPVELNSKAVWTHESIKSFVRQVVCQAIGNEALPGQALTDDDNLFVMGGDSLAATYIRNSVVRALKTHFPESGVPVGMVTSTDFVYGSPSINLLSAFVFGFAAAASHSFMGREHHIKAVTEPVQDESVQPDESSEASTFEWPKKFNQPGDTILRVREGRGEPPLIVIHGASGNPDPFIPFQENFKTGLWLVQVTTDTPRSSLREHARFYFHKIKELRPKGPYRLAAYSSGHFLACILAELFRLSGDRVDQLAFLDHYPTIFLSPLAIKSQITPENFPACVHDGSIMDPAFRLFFKRFAFLEVADTLDHEVPSRGWFMRGLMDAWEGKPSAEGIKNVAKSIERYLDECLDFAAELPGYVSSTDSRLPVQRALDAVEDWLRSPETGLGEIPRIDMFVGTYGAAVALPEEMRRECVTSGLGATHVHPNVKITEVNCGHVTILSSKEVIEGLQEGFY